MTQRKNDDRPKVLLFCTSEQKFHQIRELCTALQMRVLAVPAAEEKKTLGALAAWEPDGALPADFTPSAAAPDARPAASPSSIGEMLLFVGFDDSALDRFLKSYREKGIAPIPLKAVLTPHNIFWTPEQLYGELRKEQRAILESR